MGKNAREKLADLVHEVWICWITYLFSRCTRNDDGTLIIPAYLVARWQRQSETKYIDLTEEETESDLKIADRYLEVLKEE